MSRFLTREANHVSFSHGFIIGRFFLTSFRAVSCEMIWVTAVIADSDLTGAIILHSEDLSTIGRNKVVLGGRTSRVAYLGPSIFVQP